MTRVTTTRAVDDLVGAMSRRRFLGRAAALAAGAGLTGVVAACGSDSSSEAGSTSTAAAVPPYDASKVGGALTLLAWQGYEDKGAIGAWTKEAGVTIKPTYVAANDDFITKMKAGGKGQYDNLTPFIAYVPSLVRLDLVQPIPLAGVPNFQELFPIFQKPAVDGISAPKDSVYTVPLIWGSFTMLYLPSKIPSPPSSWTDLLDPTFKGRVIMYDDPYSQILVWAKAIGVGDGGRLTHAELDKVRDSLIELKGNARAIVPNYAEMTDLFARGEGWVSTSGWSAVMSMAAAKKTEVAETVPSEGTYSWTDTYALAADAPNRDTAIALINEVISVRAQKKFAPVLMSGITNQKAVEGLPKELSELYAYDDIEGAFAKAPMGGIPPLDRDGDIATLQDWQRAWAEVKQA